LKSQDHFSLIKNWNDMTGRIHFETEKLEKFKDNKSKSMRDTEYLINTDFSIDEFKGKRDLLTEARHRFLTTLKGIYQG